MPTRTPDLSAETKTRFQQDGVILVKHAIDQTWVDRMLQVVDELAAEAPGPYAADTGQPGDTQNRSYDGRYRWRHNPDIRALAFETRLGRLAGQAMGSREVRFYFDHIFIKEPRTDTATPWHQDIPYWPFAGQDVCSAWVALTANDVGSSALEFVRGSHSWGKRYRPKMFIDTEASWIGTSEDEACPDIESARAQYDIVSFDVEPGDALLFSAHILHSARGNLSATDRRVAISLRFLGDDATWDPRPGTDPIVTQDHVSVQPGELAQDDDVFPVVCRR